MFRHALLLATLLAGCTEAPNLSAPVSQSQHALTRSPEEAFRAWFGKYLAADERGRAELEVAGVSLAQARLESFRARLMNEPQSAIESAVHPAERSALPTSVARFVEEWRDGLGTLHVIAGTGDELAPPTLDRFVTFNTAPEEILRAAVFGERLSSGTRENIRLHGVALDGVIAVTDSRLRRLFPGEVRPNLPLELPRACPVSKLRSEPELTFNGGDTLYGFCVSEHATQFDTTLALGEAQAAADLGLPPASAWTEGPKTVLYLRVDFPDRTGDPVGQSAAQDMIDTTVNQFYQSNSFGKTSMSATVTPTLRLPKTRAQYQTNDNYLLLRSDALAVARDAGIDPSAYSLDVVAFASTYGGWAGRGYVGAPGTWLNGSFGFRTTSHELGHNYGVFHANYWNATGLTVIGPGTNVEYGNPFDVMGGGGGQANHFNAWFKRAFGWVTSAEVASVSTSSTIRIFELEKPIATGFHAAKISRDAQKDYWLEYRPGINTAHTKDGVSVNWGYQRNNGSHLLDLTPGDGSKTNSTLIIGRTFSDSLAGVHLTPIGKGGTTPESIDVVVNLGTFPGNRPPTLSLNASTQTAARNQSVTFTATASDPDGDALAYAWDFDDGTWGPNAATVTKSFSATRDFSVRLTVSDMKGGTTTRSVLITVGTPTTFRLTGTVLEGSTPLADVRVSDGTRATFTAADGTYALTNVPAGSVTVSATKVDYTFTRNFAAPLTVAASQGGLDFTATPFSGYTLRGKVTFGSPNLAGVTVSDGTRTAVTDAAGDYVLSGVPSGRYTLTASKPGWYFVASAFTNPVEVFGGDVSALNFSGGGSTLYGTIPRAGVTTAPVVTDGVRSVTATMQGTNWGYNLIGVPPGTWNLLATSPGVTLTPSGFTNPVEVMGVGVFRGNLNFSATAGTRATVSGTVTTGGTPLPNVVISDGTRTATSDSLGHYTLVGVPPGTYTLTPTRAGDTFVPSSLAVTVAAADLTGKDFSTSVVNLPPTLTAASANPTVVTGLTTQLRALATDDRGEANLRYTWTTVGTVYPVVFSANGTNAAKNATVTFSGSGTYTFECTVMDAGGLSARSAPVSVQVQQVSSGLEITPPSATVSVSAVRNFQANLRDQFGKSMFAGNPSWSVSGGGTVPMSGSFVPFTADAVPGGPYVLTATVDGRTATALITVVGPGSPMILGSATATPNPVAGTTTQLAVRASDDSGEAALTYHWATSLAPAAVTFSANDDNAAKNSTATFTAAGAYSFVVTVTDAQGNSVNSSVNVTVQATPTKLDVQPRVASLQVGQTQPFTATTSDQFDDPLALQPALTWTVSSGGTVDGAGLFTADPTPGGPHTLTVSSGALTATAVVTLVVGADSQAPLVSITAPVGGTQLSTTSALTATASDNIGVTQVEFFLDGTTSLGIANAAPWTVSFDFATVADGAHVLTARAADAAGNVGTSDGVNISTGVGPQDLTPPSVQLTAPGDGTTTPLAVQFAANATDDVGVTSLQFELDGAVVSTLTAAPWTFALTVSEGAHVLVAIAFDASGKQARSSVVTFTATAGETPTLEPERVVGGCGCSTDANALSALELLALAGFWAKRRRTR